jgi:hypothetical protein
MFSRRFRPMGTPFAKLMAHQAQKQSFFINSYAIHLGEE